MNGQFDKKGDLPIYPRIDMKLWIAQRISRTPPGHESVVSWLVMQDVVPLPGWSPAESIMENITGSAYEFTFWEDPWSGNTIFRRLKEPLKDGYRTYVSPDRRHMFKRRGDLYEPLRDGDKPQFDRVDPVNEALKAVASALSK